MKTERVEHGIIDLKTGDFESLPELDEFCSKDLILQKEFQSIHPIDFYRYIFPEGSFERLGHPEDKKPNGVAVVIDENTQRASKVIVTDGFEQLSQLLSHDFVVMSPISYFGRSRRADHAVALHALTLDIDYVEELNLNAIIGWVEKELIPRPTFIVNSGHGVHLYYVFEQPIMMTRRNQEELTVLKKNLIDQTWTRFTSARPDRKEALGLTQGFRMVGSRTKLKTYSLSAYQTGDRITVDYLNAFAWSGCEAVLDQPSTTPLEEAKKLWPDWYERRIVRGEQPGRWYIKRDLYDWFLRRIEGEGIIGHRYFCMMCLAVYAAKCDIEEDELRRDATRIQKIFSQLGEKTNEPFTWEETEKALEAYNESYVKFPRETIERITAISMPANKRNYQKQEFHLEEARAIRDIRQKRKGANWWDNGNRSGAPTKEALIKAYKKEHPEATQREIAKALGVSPTTVNKWLKAGSENGQNLCCD